MQRKWQIGPYENEQGQLYPFGPEERDREMIHLGWLIDRTGGSAVIAPLRTRSGEGFTTVGLAVRFEIGNIPAVDVPKPPEVAEPPEVPEPSADSSASSEVAEPEVLAAPEPALAE